MAPFDPLAPEVLKKAVFDRRFSILARTGVDVGILGTWDRTLARNLRILVPIDVQAFVVPAQGGEATVPMKGHDPDPAPFAAGAVRPAGVHLHWAMPDALVRGTKSADGTRLELPALPDRWVVVRALLPEGGRQAIVSGWVIDAPSATVSALAGFAGTFAEDPAAVVFKPLDAGYGGSLLWTASYAACERRFALHDPLDDLASFAGAAPQGFCGAHAVYTVAGWWSDGGQDPLSGVAGSSRLDSRLAELGWLVVHDGEDDDVLVAKDPRMERFKDALGLDAPAVDPPVEVTREGKTEQLKHEGIVPDIALPVDKVAKVVLGPKLPTYSTLVHGAVMGVPIDGQLPAGADDRPPPAALGVALGLDVDDVVSAFGAEALGLSSAQRLAAERLVAAFAGNLLDRLGTPDGLSELEEREHAEGFWSLPGPPVAGAQPDRLRVEDSAAVNPNTVGRKGRAGAALGAVEKLSVKTEWKRKVRDLEHGTGDSTARRTEETQRPAPAPGATRDVVRAAPRLYRPQPPLVALRGAKPSHRHHDDGLYDESGRLRCRYPGEVVTGVEGVVEGDAILPTLANGAIPDEVLSIVREAILLDPYAHSWLAAAGAPPAMLEAARARMLAETVRLYGTSGTYDPSGRASVVPAALGAAPHAGAIGAPHAPADPWANVSRDQALLGAQVAAEVARFSLVRGTPPSPIAITTWRQPWVPLWLEWRVTLEGDEAMRGWDLASIDLAAQGGQEAPGTALSFEFVGRATINERVGDALHSGITEWLAAEQRRDLANPSESQLSDEDEAALGALNDKIGPVDLVSASLDGVREQLLGISYVGHVARGPAGPDGKSLPLASGLPTPLFGGTLRVDALRLVDAFGRTLDVPLADVHTTSTLEVPGAPTSIQLRPRFQHAARWLFRLVDPAHPIAADPLLARDAFVDQGDPASAVNPVIGFLLPDHVDEALEIFDVAGAPLGQLGHDEITGAVDWEPAPGRPLPPDAGPLAGLDDHTRLAGLLAAGVVQADVAARAAERPPAASSLSAMLRAIDTTLWTVDTFGATGSPSVAGLVGRPIAMVRAMLRLEVPDDVLEVFVSEAGGPDARRAAFAALNELSFPVRIGDLQRSDDSVLGFFVDDDYLHMHVVDKVVMAASLESGRHRGFLGLLGGAPKKDPIDHDFLVDEDTLWVRPGQVVRLTILMLPAGKVHLTSGILPRKALALGDDWVTPGLVKLMPSLRVGPVLVDPAEIRLPLVKALGERQTFTRRTGPLTWRDDPIVAATQTALLPRLPHEVQEGWVRVTPGDAAGET